jgi:hypothetical protein
VLVRELLEEIERTLHHEPVVVVGQHRELANERRLALDQRSRAIRLCDVAAIPAAQERA